MLFGVTTRERHVINKAAVARRGLLIMKVLAVWLSAVVAVAAASVVVVVDVVVVEAAVDN